MQELSTSSSSDGERSEYDIRDREIAQSLRVDEESIIPVPPSRSRVRTALRGFGLLMMVVGVVAAFGFIFYGGMEEHNERTRLEAELKQVEAFVQYEPEEVVFVEEDFSDDTLVMIAPPPK